MSETNKKKVSSWNSLELTKIFIGLLTPLAILFFTQQTNQRLDQSNKIQDNNKRVFENRQKFYDQVGTILNDFYCYPLYVGNWKGISPAQLIREKRKVDQMVYTYSPFFDADFNKVYNGFISSVFKTYNSMGGDAKIRSESSLHKTYYKSDTLHWSEDWDTGFTNEDNREEVYESYFSLLREIAKELNLKVDYSNERMPDQKPVLK